MASTRQHLLLKIEQAGKTFYQRLTRRDRISVGRHPENDIMVYGDEFPKKHVLFSGKNNHFQLNLQQYMQGEVLAGDSRLSFRDLFLHNLLPRRGDTYAYPLTQNKKGYVQIGDARISFQFVDDAAPAVAGGGSFRGYSWAYATLKELRHDLFFKAILAVMIVSHFMLLRYLQQLPAELPGGPAVTAAPERLARFIVKSPAAAALEEGRAAVQGSEAPEEATEDTEPQSGEKRPGTAVENQGVLGLLTGTGNAAKSGTLADFLLDKELVQELDEIMSATNLSTGGGGSDAALDELFAGGEAGGGIDDILTGLDEVETVTLSKKGAIALEKIDSMTGSASALGRRSEESVRRVLLANQGRLTYIYNKYLKHDPDLAGKMVVEVEIAADGSMAAVRLLSSSMNEPDFEREILDFIRTWRFEAIDQGTVTVTYPLVFNKTG